MNLQEFITETLTQIVAGVADAQQQIQKTDPSACINPSDVRRGRTAHEDATITEGDARTVERVTFDVVLTVEKGKGSKGGVGVFVGAVGLGTQGQSEAKDTSLSRVTFSVPVVLPKTD